MTKHDQASYTTNDAAFWKEAPAIVREDAPGRRARVFDLEERTARFGEAVIDFARLIPRSSLTDRLISQLIGCGTSVGANYSEADDAVSKKAFFLSINPCRKEAARPLWQEAKELNLIFAKICRSK